MRASSRVLTVALAVVLSAMALALPLASQAEAGGTVSGGGKANFSVSYSWGPCTGQPGSCGVLYYTVFTNMGGSIQYLDSYVYPSKWHLGERRISSCILNVTTYPNRWDATNWMDIYNPGGSLAYSYGLSPGGGVICPSGSWAYSWIRTIQQEYVNKGGAYGLSWTYVYSSQSGTQNLSGWLGYYTNQMP